MELEKIETVCKNDCAKCANTITDRNIDRKGCINVFVPIEEVFVERKQKRHKIKQSVRNTIQCDCGNNIPVGRNTTERKCFNCNHYLFKINGKWERQEHEVKRDTLTIGDIKIKRRKK